MSDKKRVYTVDEVTAHIEGNVLTVTAKGKVRTGGWKDPELVPMRSPGGTTFELVATPPSGMATQVISHVKASYRSGPLEPPFPTSVDVKAETNEKKAPVG